GGHERKLAELSFIDSPTSVAWSPDGTSLAVIDQEAPNQPAGIFLLSIDTNEKRKLTSPPLHSGGDIYPAFSPDGRALAFVRLKTSAFSGDILVQSLSETLQPQGEPRLLMSSGQFLYGLTWTLDGREILTAPRINTASSDSLWRIPADGSGNRERLAFTGDQSGNPSLSRQGRRLAYSRRTCDLNIWRLELAGAERRARPPAKFIASTRSEGSAQFSPDGKRVAFYSNRSGTDEIWVSNSDGSGAIQITSLGGP